ncbi:hypothetical protein HELRODRAFT_173818 [Helobdella robusta]|uniref:Uncharacterized protein n=1 Tax=Helobdella robusta TaxID=6412 RepID=T1F798_HELRO|nr:hypothetical protein HELRODRAFT_173818 [Helobdella robusta]ESO02983.1 hypothetical protein HELRODRAFT_173818 [Helobdella robusta]
MVPLSLWSLVIGHVRYVGLELEATRSNAYNEWNLDSTTANENGHVFDIEHSNDEFSKKMKEEYTASVIKNSLIHLKKKISGIKSLKKLDDTGPSDVKKVEVLNGSQGNCNKQKVLKKEGLLRKRKLSTSDEPAAKIMKNCKSSFGMSPNATSLSRKTKTDKGTERPAVEVVNRSSQKFLTCRGPNCSQRSQDGSSYCGPACIEAHVSLSLKLLGDDGKVVFIS